MGRETCQLPPTICGSGDVTFIQLPNARFVHDCNEKPDTGGHETTRSGPDCEMIRVGGVCGVALAGALLVLSPPVFNALTT